MAMATLGLGVVCLEFYLEWCSQAWVGVGILGIFSLVVHVHSSSTVIGTKEAISNQHPIHRRPFLPFFLVLHFELFALSIKCFWASSSCCSIASRCFRMLSFGMSSPILCIRAFRDPISAWQRLPPEVIWTRIRPGLAKMSLGTALYGSMTCVSFKYWQTSDISCTIGSAQACATLIRRPCERSFFELMLFGHNTKNLLSSMFPARWRGHVIFVFGSGGAYSISGCDSSISCRAACFSFRLDDIFYSARPRRPPPQDNKGEASLYTGNLRLARKVVP